MTLATLAAGIGCSLPEVATKPRLWTPTAAEPRVGQGMTGGVPAITSLAGGPPLAATSGMGRR